MAAYGLRPIGIGVGSALFQLNLNDGFQTPFNGTISLNAFFAQAAIGSGLGYVGEGVGQILTKRRAYLFYHASALRLGHDVAYPIWLGSYHLFQTVIPAGMGVTEEHLENKAQDRWPSQQDASTPKP